MRSRKTFNAEVSIQRRVPGACSYSAMYANAGRSYQWNNHVKKSKEFDCVTQYQHFHADETDLLQRKSLILGISYRIALLAEGRRSTTVPRNDPLLLPSDILVHASKPRIHLVAQQTFAQLVNVLGPSLYLCTSEMRT